MATVNYTTPYCAVILPSMIRSLVRIAALCVLTGCTNDGQRPDTLRGWREKALGGDDAAHHAAAPAPSRTTGDDAAPESGAAAAQAPAVQPAPSAAARSDGAAGPREPVRLSTSGSGRLLTVNGETITVEEILQPIRARLVENAQTQSPNDYYAGLVKAVRDQIITEVAERLVWREAKRQLTEDTDKQIDAAVERIERDRIQREFGGRESRYEAALVEEGTTREKTRLRIRRRLVVQQWVRDRLLPRVSITRRELMSYYQQNQHEFTKGGRVEMFLIDIPLRSLLSSSELNDAARLDDARRQARATLEEALSKIRDGTLGFEDAARRYSKGLNAQSGGKWGFISEPLQGYWEAPSKQVLAFSAGQMSKVCDGPDCVYIVKAGGVDPPRVTGFEAAQPRIMEKVRQQRLSAMESEYLQSLLEQADISPLDPFVQAVIEAAPESQKLPR